jgi:hypothetical protein
MTSQNPLDYLDAPNFETNQGFIDMVDPNQKYAITTDWFSAILSSSDMNLVVFDTPLDEYIYDAGNIVFSKMKYAAPMFNFAYEIYFKGKMFGKVHVCPKKNGVLKPNNMQFELENNVQYEIGWLDDMKYFFNTMRWEVRNVSRCDIALDGGGFFKVFEKYLSGSLQRKGGGKEQVFAHCSGGKRILDGFDFGSRASSKWITCYNKTQELKGSNKDYILRYWERTGLDTRNVERLELKLRNDALKEINFDWQKMDDFEYLASIFRTFVDGGYVSLVDTLTGECFRKNKKGMIQFVQTDEDKNISRKKKINFVNWQYIGAKKLERFSTEKANEVWAMKVTCKRLCLLAYALKDKFPERSQNFLMEAHEVAKNINCLKWLVDKYDEWIRQFSLMKLDYLPGYTLNIVKETRQVFSLQRCKPANPDLFFVRM